MAGSEYRNGVVFDSRGSTHTASITYNVMGDYSKVSFYMGHLDNTNKQPIELMVYLDNVFYSGFTMDADDIPQFIEIDVKNKSTIRFTAELKYDTGYCLADAVIE